MAIEVVRYANITLSIIALILFAVTAGFDFKAANEVKKITDWGKDETLKRVNQMLVWSGILGVIGAALIIFALIVQFTTRIPGRFTGTGLLALATFLIVVAVIMTFVANSQLRANAKFEAVKTTNTAARDTMIAGIAGLFAAVLTFVTAFTEYRRITVVTSVESPPLVATTAVNGLNYGQTIKPRRITPPSLPLFPPSPRQY